MGHKVFRARLEGMKKEKKEKEKKKKKKKKKMKKKKKKKKMISKFRQWLKTKLQESSTANDDDAS